MALIEKIPENLMRIQEQIRAWATKYARRPEDIQLLAVSKTHPASAILAAHQAGQRAFGESYLQEALEKIQSLANYELEWHYIGRIQSNKTRDIAGFFSWVHSVDRLKIAERLSQQRDPAAPPLNICLEINISRQDSKAGIDPDDTRALLESIRALPNLQLRGLMALPAPYPDFASQRQAFGQLRELRDQLNQELGLQMDTLSMGMSNDMEAAIAEGATIVRIGTAIFGQRQQKPAELQ